jgi:hypothetical protein
MASQGNNASDRLKDYFAAATEIGATVEKSIAAFGAQYGVELTLTDLDWTDPDNPLLMTHIGEAFVHAGLDPRIPWHWRLLLHCFASAHYATNKPRKWSSRSYCALLQAADFIKSKHPELTSDSAVCQRLIDEVPKYKNLDVHHLRKMLRHARNPDKNHLLNMVAESALEVIRELGRTRGLPSLEQIALALKPVFVREACQNIGSAWRKRTQNTAGHFPPGS